MKMHGKDCLLLAVGYRRNLCPDFGIRPEQLSRSYGYSVGLVDANEEESLHYCAPAGGLQRWSSFLDCETSTGYFRKFFGELSAELGRYKGGRLS
jgi:hypothetical protein